MNGHANELTMTTNNPYILFSKSLEQCRQLGRAAAERLDVTSACDD